MYYVDTDTGKFTSKHTKKEPCGCSSERPVFLQTRRGCGCGDSIQRPRLVNYQHTFLEFQLLDSDKKPVDLTDCYLNLSVDDNFSHSDSLICPVTQGTVADPLQGIVSFNVDCFSKKFEEVLRKHIPAQAVYMQMQLYNAQHIDGKIVLQDNGVKLLPRLHTTQSAPQSGDSNYYNKQQVNALINSIVPGASDSSQGSTFNGQGEPPDYIGLPGDTYIDTLNKAIYIKYSDGWRFIGYFEEQSLDLVYEIVQ